jgi:predicted N-acetyltransferase YhbS
MGEIERAIEVFVRGFCAQKSATHPYEFYRIGKVWVMRDGERKNPKNYRKEEWVAFGVQPREVDKAARKGTRGRFFVCAVRGMEETDERLKAEYKAMGYRLLGTEPLFVHGLKKVPQAENPIKIERVQSPEMAIKFGKATRSKPIKAELLVDKAPFRQYVALEDGVLVGWVRSVDAGDAAWCANMHVKPSHRRRGIGRALLCKMLRDDRARGARKSVLLSSHTGALVYPRVGYEQIGNLMIFAPRKAKG